MVRRFSHFTNKQTSIPIKVNLSVGLSGATIQEIKWHIKSNKVNWHSNIPLLLFVGTNDIFRNTPIHFMQQQLLSLLKYIRRQNPQIKIILTQLPMYPRSANNAPQIALINQFNQFLHTLTNQHTKFFQTNSFLDPVLDFHFRYRHNGKVDKIHLNCSGNQKLLSYLSQLL